MEQIKMVDYHGEAFEAPGYMVGQHWAMAQNKKGHAWSLTHVPSAGIIGEWDESTCLELSGILTVPAEFDIAGDADALRAVPGFAPWFRSVVKAGDEIHASRAAERLAEHVKGYTMFSVDVTREQTVTVYVVAENRRDAERMAQDAYLNFDDDDGCVTAYAGEVKTFGEHDKYDLGDEVEAPKGFPRATVRDAAVALGIPMPEEGK